MGITVNVNKLTVVHAGSTGIAISFPDPCKTPTPGGPVPIPYPNIAQSSDTASGSKTVKVDGNPVMLKNSNFMKSTGDEAGTVGGIMSSKFIGKACPLNTSFDVKIDGKPVFRLTDPMKTNCGSQNAVCLAELQQPIPEMPDMPEECKELKKKQKDGETMASEKSGMLQEHFDKLKEIADAWQVILYMRQTAPVCKEWIENLHQPKPHKVFRGNTIEAKAFDPEDPRKGTRVDAAQRWLDDFAADLEEKARVLPEATRGAFVAAKIHETVTAGQLRAGNVRYSARAEEFKGVVGGTRPSDMMEPLKAVAGGVRDAGLKYGGCWITADYDIYELLWATELCVQVHQQRGFVALRVEINKKLGWDAIQHGPQTQWVPTKKEKRESGAPKVNFPMKVKEGFKNNNAKENIPIPGRSKGMKVFDDNLTVIAPGGTLYLDTQEETFDALKCRDCDK